MKHLAIKVTNKYESEAVQKELISLGYRWLSNDDNTFDLSSNLPVVILCTPLSVLAWRNFSLDMMKEDIVIMSSSDFFSTYAGHIERFPDYVDPILDDPEVNKNPTDCKKYLYSIWEKSYKSNKTNLIFSEWILLDIKESETLNKTTIDTFKDKKIAITIDNKEQCVEIQKKLFDIGIEWIDTGKELHTLNDVKILFIKDCNIVKCSNFFSGCPQCEYKTDCISHVHYTAKEFLEKYFPEDKKSKFKVGDYIWLTYYLGIEQRKIIHVDCAKEIISVVNHNNILRTDVTFSDIDTCGKCIWFSTPELAAKRFLELNK